MQAQQPVRAARAANGTAHVCNEKLPLAWLTAPLSPSHGDATLWYVEPLIAVGAFVAYDNKGDSAAPLPLFARFLLWLATAGFVGLLAWSYAKQGF